MSNNKKLNRREFLKDSVLKTGLVALSGGAIGASVLRAVAGETPAASTPAPAPQPHAEIPKLKHRTLGRTKIEVSEIVGASDGLGDFLLFMKAWESGVNYFHKAERVFGHPRQREVLLKNRERAYLDVVIDNLQEQPAYDEFEAKRKQIGSEYVDFFKVHSTWVTVEDFQNKRGVLAAYDRLRKENKVRWLALSKHGPNTPEVLTAAMESGMFDAIQPAVPDIKDFQQVLKTAKDKNVGVICMKTGAALRGKMPELAKFGDPAKPYQTYFRYLLGLDGVTGIVSQIKNFDQMRENYGASGNPLQKAEVEALTVAFANAPVNYRDCIACGECHGACPDRLAVSDIMRFRMYAEDYGDLASAREMYGELPAAWKNIVASGKGISASTCPYGLPLADELKQAHRWLA